jgi:polysaccharide export outer membrane protein
MTINFSRILSVFFVTLAFVAASMAQEAVQSPATPVAPVPVPSANKPPDPSSIASNNGPSGFAERNPRYRLRAGDSFDVSFTFQPEYNQTVAVQPDGFITLRDIGDVHVQGLTLPDVRAALVKAYSPILHRPVVSVVLKDFEKPFFIAGGEVQHPGKFEMRSDTTATQALQIAGGMTENAKHSDVWLFRRVSVDLYESKKLDIKKMLAQGDLHEDARLQPGDMLYVPKSTLGKISRFIPKANIGTYLNPAQF